MWKRIALVLLLAGIVVSAKTYTFNLSNPTRFGTATLKPGEYKVNVDGEQVLLLDRTGHEVEATAKVESSTYKYSGTAIEMVKADGTDRVVAVELGGTSTKIVFE